MKRTTVTLKIRDPFGLGIGCLDREVQGYECEVFGIPMVVHRTSFTDEKVRRDWTVTEPTTGGAVGTGKTREQAIEAAEKEAFERGGANGIRRHITRLSRELSEREGASQ